MYKLSEIDKIVKKCGKYYIWEGKLKWIGCKCSLICQSIEIQQEDVSILIIGIKNKADAYYKNTRDLLYLC